MDTNTSIDVYGIVVGMKIPNRQFFVWCKESKSDFLLQMDSKKPVELGTWVNMRFNGSECQNPNFKVNNYVVITPIYKTEVDGNTVRLQLEHYLNSNLKELDHWFFGKILNNRNKEFSSDVYYLTIKKIRNASGDIWVMENVEATEPKQPDIPGIIGIVSWSGKNNNKHFVWCKERKADHDVVIFSDNSNIKVGTWLKLDLCLDQLSQEYLPCPNFTVIPYPIHPTFPSENDKICLRLELDVLEGSQNISHPFVGEIINKFASFDKSGRYTITIIRNKIGSQVGWFLKARELKQPNDLIALLTGREIPQNYQNIRHQESIQHTINPQSFARQRSSIRDELEPCRDSPPQTAPRYSRLQHQTNILGTQSDTSLTRNARPQRSVSRPRNETPAAPRQRSASRPRQQENPIRPILKQQPRPRNQSRVRFQSPNVEITGIVVAQSPYFFYVWCRERLPGLDIAIPKSDFLSLTDWIQFSITRDELDTSFPSDPKFEIREFRRITSKFQTDLSKTGKSVTIKLDMEIERNSRIEDIHHDVMGLIINERFEFQQSGKYSITISRLKKGENPRSVWYIQSAEMQSAKTEMTGIVVAQDPKHFYVWCRERLPGLDIAIPKPASLSLTDWIQFSVSNELIDYSFKSDAAFKIEEFQIIPSVLPTNLSKTGKSVTIKLDMEIARNPRIENIHHDVMGLIINEKFEFQQTGMYLITIYRTKKGENPKSVWYTQSVEMAPPTPMPRGLPLSSAVRENNPKRAIIMNISIFKHDETINVWIFDLKQQGTVKLNTPTEKLNLTAGDMFEAVFTNMNGTWFSPGPVTKIKNSYTTRLNNNSSEVEILVVVEAVSEPDPSHRYLLIDHDDFGEILDINDRVQNHTNLLYKVWIHRAQVGDNYQWVVLDQTN